MKTYIYLIFLCFFTNVNSQVYNVPSNVSCVTPQIVCNNSQYYYTFLGDSIQCTTTLYFALNFSNINGETSINSLLPSSGIAWLYGPIQSLSSACDSISNSSILVDSSVFIQSDFGGVTNIETGWHILKLEFEGCAEQEENEDFVNGVKVGFKGSTVHCLLNEIDICQDCITSFSPNAGKYLVSAWVKEEGATMTTTNYTHSSIDISYSGDPSTTSLSPVGQIIDGWQRIEGIITVPVSATDIHLSFETSSGTSYYDDIRFHPLDGSMMSYVYDPISLRLMAELDERNYATLYEYDEEGKLIRVKKETEKGIMTIQENRDNIRKQ